MPDLLDRIDLEIERLSQRHLGKSGGDADPKLARRQLEQGEAPGGVEMIEHLRQRPGRLGPAEQSEPLDHIGDPKRPVVEIGGLILGCRPEQRHRLGHVADIVPTHVEQGRIHAFLDDGPDRGGLDRRKVELAGQGRQRITAVGIRGAPEIIADQLQLEGARARVDERVEKLGEFSHRAVSLRQSARRTIP